MKSFKQFIYEEPLPLDVDYRELESKQGSYESTSVIEKFNSFGLKIGQGSSRVAFKVLVPSSRFKGLNTYDLQLSDNINTVFKIALYHKGILQNKAEINNWEKAVKQNLTDFLLPILDTSYKNKQRELQINNKDSGIKLDGKESNWIQMPLAEEVNNYVFEKEFIKLFGDWKKIANENDFEINYLWTDDEGNNLYSFVVFEEKNWKKILYKIIEFDNENNQIITSTQLKNINKLIDTIKVLKLGVGDLAAHENWGLLNGQLKILDYGFANDVIDVYVGKSEAKADVTKDGNINIIVTKK